MDSLYAAIENWRTQKKDYEAFLKHVDENGLPETLPQPMTKEEFLSTRINAYNKWCEENGEEINEFLTELRAKLKVFEEYDTTFFEYMCALEDCDCDRRVQSFVNEVHNFREYIRNKLNDVIEKEALQDMLADIGLEDEHLDIVKKFYLTTTVGDEIISHYIQHQKK